MRDLILYPAIRDRCEVSVMESFDNKLDSSVREAVQPNCVTAVRS